MRTAQLLLLVATLSACSAPHAVRVRCDERLVPINKTAASVADPLANATNPVPATAAGSVAP